MSRERKGLSELRSGKSRCGPPAPGSAWPPGPGPPLSRVPVPVSAELYFLIARFLEDGPCQQAAQVRRAAAGAAGAGGGRGGARAGREAEREDRAQRPALLLQVLIREVAEKEVSRRGPPGACLGGGGPGPRPGAGAAGCGWGSRVPGPGGGGGAAAALTACLPAAAAAAHRLDREGAPQDLPEPGEPFSSPSSETFPGVE